MRAPVAATKNAETARKLAATLGFSAADRLRTGVTVASALATAAAVDTAAPEPGPPELAGLTDDVLPVPASLAGLLPGGGLRRGWTVSVTSGTALMVALVAEATQAGAWCAVVGMPTLGVLAAAELGTAVQRLALVPRPGDDAPAVIAALMDGCEVVLVGPDCRLTPAYVRRLSARARSRRVVLLTARDWPGAQVQLTCETVRWHGLGSGNGRLVEREVVVRASGRSAAAQTRSARVLLPARGGGLAPERKSDTARPGWYDTPRVVGARSGLTKVDLGSKLRADPLPNVV
ncbi:hypothetical protein GCM10009765_47370 [Fodinicola feengrottensis]|uniref:Recombinase A n=1 Tax=Fodinicola feengrottensis TaxID=435914 RepID=A0ABP4TRQ9_9ACTN